MRKSRSSSRKYSVPALEKGLDILEALASAAVPQSLSELARSMDRTASQLFRMLSALEARGYIERDPLSGKYGLTLRLYELAHTHSPVEKLLRAAAIPMRLLAEQIKESCHISTLDQERLVVLTQVESPEVYRFSVEIGFAYSPIHTASGRLLLAYLSEEVFQHFCEASAEYAALDVPARKRFLARLWEIRENGISTGHDEPVIGVQSYAVLIGKPEVDITAALAVASLQIRGKKQNVRETVEALKCTSREINRAIGLRV